MRWKAQDRRFGETISGAIPTMKIGVTPTKSREKRVFGNAGRSTEEPDEPVLHRGLRSRIFRLPSRLEEVTVILDTGTKIIMMGIPARMMNRTPR